MRALGIMVAIGVSVGGLAWNHLVESSKPMKVLFSLKSLDLTKDSFIDPSNLDSVYQYYVFENLAVGLIRDNKDEPTGYEPVLIESWQQESESQWSFTLKEDLRWSDGSPITKKQILHHLQSLAKKDSRHLVQLHKIKKVLTDFQDPSKIIVIFNGSVTRGILHELSLADAALIHPTVKNFSVTSGAYYLASKSIENQKITLKKNTHSPLQRLKAPQEVIIFDQSGLDESKQEFAKLLEDFDIVDVPSPLFSKLSLDIVSSGIDFHKGAWSTVYFLSVGEKSSLVKNERMRKSLSFLVRRALDSIKLVNGLSVTQQVIPEGYDGRLDNYTALDIDLFEFPKDLTIRLTNHFENFPSFKQALINNFSKYEINLKVKYIPYFDKNQDHDLRLTIFTGNQKDATTSWNFLVSNGGALSPFSNQLKHLLSQINSASGNEKSLLLERLHKQVLDQSLLIPMFVERLMVGKSRKVSLSKWNPFDMRFRFYDVEQI